MDWVIKIYSILEIMAGMGVIIMGCFFLGGASSQLTLYMKLQNIIFALIEISFGFKWFFIGFDDLARK